MLKYILLIFLLLSIFCKEKECYFKDLKQDSIYLMNFYKNSNIKDNDWTLINNIPAIDTNNALMVVIIDKAGIFTKVFYCMAIFENSKKTEYLLVAPWFENIIIYKSNIFNKKSSNNT